MKKIVLMISLISACSLFGAISQLDIGMPATTRIQFMYWTDASGQAKKGVTPDAGSTNIGIGSGPVQWKTYADFENYIKNIRITVSSQPNPASYRS